MASLNIAQLIGNLGQDPEVRYMPNGDAVANLSIATTESWKDKATGEKREETTWHRVTMYRRLAEIAGEYLRKGASVYVSGRIQHRKYQDKKTGEDRYSTEIVADELKMLGGKRDAGDGSAPPARAQQAPQHNTQPADDGFGDQDIPF